MKKHFCILLSIVIFVIILANMCDINTVEALSKANNSIDSFIYNMEYDNQDILTRNGDKIENVPPRQSIMQNGKFIVVKRDKKSIINNSADISVINSNNANIYPGAILRADKQLLDNHPTVVFIPRDKITISVDLPGMSFGDSHIVVLSPTTSGVREGINNLLTKWNNNYCSDYPNIPARLEYNESMAYSMSQLQAKFGASFSELATPLNLNFDIIQSGEKQVMIVNFKQIYYTVSVDTPNYPHEFFDKEVTAEDLSAKGLSSKTPPVYVSDVSYGRSIFVKLETDSRSTKVKEAFNAYISGADIKNNAEYQEVLKSMTFTAMILGGDAGSASNVVTGKIDGLKKYIEGGASYSKLSPGVPISYTTKFIKDNSQATISSYSEYIQTTSTSYSQGVIRLDHSGAYVARFYIDWDELSYDKDGNEVWKHNSWDKNGWNFTAHWSEEVQIPANAHNLHIVAQKCTGLAWQWWQNVYDKTNVPLVKQRNINIWGTTLYHGVSDEILE